MLLAYKGAKAQQKRWIIGCAVIAITGVTLVWLPIGDGLAKLSFDVPFLFRDSITSTNVVVVLEDRASLDALGQRDKWPPSRAIHAALVDKLREGGAKVIAFDIFFRAEKPEEDAALAGAMRRHGNVILGGVRETSTRNVAGQVGHGIMEIKTPPDALRTNAAAWGLLIAGNLDASFGVRKMTTVWHGYPAVAWLAAQRSGALPTGKGPETERWINFYGPSPSVDQVTLEEVMQSEGARTQPGFFRNKIVFIGFDPSAQPASDVHDVFATPYTRFHHDFAPGAEVLATACANLTGGDWLRLVSTPAQCLIVTLFAMSAVVLLICVGRQRAIWVAILLFALLLAATLVLQWGFGVWWNWLAAGAVQLPFATLLAYLCPRLPRVAFISYRREGGEDFALAVLHSLWARGYEAFLDVQDISGGEWLPQLLAGIDRAPNFILILSPGALEDRKDGEADWVRKEILHALSRNKRIIPVQLDGFAYPRPLPAGMEKLPALEVITHHHDQPKPTFDKLEMFVLEKAQRLTRRD